MKGCSSLKRFTPRPASTMRELVAPYSTVIDIDPDKLPDPKSVMGWSSSQYAGALRHVESSPHYDPNFRQLLHVGFKVAAGMGKRFTGALEANEQIVARNVTENLFERHLQPIFA